MRILYVAGRELSYQRNEVVLRALRRFTEVDAIGVSKRPKSLMLNSLLISIQAVLRIISNKYDLVFVGFYGHLIMLIVGLLSRKPIIFDAFISTYDTLTSDRKLTSPDSLTGKLAYWLDRTSCRLANRVLLDTLQHVQFFSSSLRIPKEKLYSFPVGCNEDLFFRRSAPKKEKHTVVLYYSSYQPLHGCETVIRAAALLKSERIHFRMIGGGQDYEKVKTLSQEFGLEQVDFLPEIPLEQLPYEIAMADICLGGHFGTSEKANRVIPGKVYQILAMAQPLIAADSLANRELLQHGKDAYLCPPGNEEALAQAILEMHQCAEMRVKLAAGGRKTYDRQCSEAVITSALQNLLN